jgi:hypothetical protein
MASMLTRPLNGNLVRNLTILRVKLTQFLINFYGKSPNLCSVSQSGTLQTTTSQLPNTFLTIYLKYFHLSDVTDLLL